MFIESLENLFFIFIIIFGWAKNVPMPPFVNKCKLNVFVTLEFIGNGKFVVSKNFNYKKMFLFSLEICIYIYWHQNPLIGFSPRFAHFFSHSVAAISLSLFAFTVDLIEFGYPWILDMYICNMKFNLVRHTEFEILLRNCFQNGTIAIHTYATWK